LKIPYLSDSLERRKLQIQEKKLSLEERNNSLANIRAELEEQIKKDKKALEELRHEREKIKSLNPIDATDEVTKRTRMDKIRKQKVEIEVSDTERTITYSAKIEDGIYITWKEGRTKYKKIIATPAKRFERPVAFGLWYARGIKYFIKKHADATHNPDASTFELRQVKFVLRMVQAVKDAEMHNEMAKATKGKTKEALYFIIALVIVSVVGILGSGGYFK